MSEPQVVLDPSNLNPIEEKLRVPLQDQLTSALQAATDTTRHHYAGEPVEQVAAQLLTRAKEHLHPDIAAAFEPDPAQLRQVAESIVHGH